MSVVSDDAVLAILKRHGGLCGVIASAETLQDAEKLAIRHYGGPGVFHEKERLAREFLRGLQATPGAEIVGEAGQ